MTMFPSSRGRAERSRRTRRRGASAGVFRLTRGGRRRRGHGEMEVDNDEKDVLGGVDPDGSGLRAFVAATGGGSRGHRDAAVGGLGSARGRAVHPGVGGPELPAMGMVALRTTLTRSCRSGRRGWRRGGTPLVWRLEGARPGRTPVAGACACVDEHV